MMVKLAARYPWYGWEHNAGYATREHRAAILEHGLTPFHRRSFHALDILLAGEQQTLDLYLNGELDTELQPEVDTEHHPERDADLPGELDSELEMIGA